MGLFNNDPAEKKAYWKAFSTALKKPDAKTFAELDKACQAWPEGWEGNLLMALSYDLAAGVEFDPEKAQAYHLKTKEAGRTVDSKWVRLFYEMYDGSPVNFRMEGDYYPRTERMRKLGPAILFTYSPDEINIMGTGIFSDDLNFWETLLGHIDTGGFFKSSDEQNQVYRFRDPFLTYVSDYQAYRKKKDQADMAERGKSLVKAYNRTVKVKKTEVDSSTVDMWCYVLAYSNLMGGVPYVFNGSGWHANSRIDAWQSFWYAATLGCSCAVRTLAEFFDDDTFHDEIVYGAQLAFPRSNVTEIAVIEELCRYTKLAAEKGDQECSHYNRIFNEKRNS